MPSFKKLGGDIGEVLPSRVAAWSGAIGGFPEPPFSVRERQVDAAQILPETLRGSKRRSSLGRLDANAICLAVALANYDGLFLATLLQEHRSA